MIGKWAKERWEKRWEHYLSTIPESRKTPAHKESLGRQRNKLHQRLRRAEGSLAIQLRTEKVGFAAFLHARRVPDVVSPACQCGWRRQDPKHVVIFFPEHTRNRRGLYESAGTDRYDEIMSTGKGLRAVTRWVTSQGLLSQFSLAKEQRDRAKGRAGDRVGEEERVRGRKGDHGAGLKKTGTLVYR